ASLLERNGMTPDLVRNVLDLTMDLVYIGFSPDISAEEVQRWQAALDQMKKGKSFLEIHKRWLPQESPPEVLQLMTEDYPPVTFRKDGKITGLATEMVQEVLRRKSIPDNIRMSARTTAYNLALLNPNVVLFSTERTAQREKLFQWVGPIGMNKLSFYAKWGSGQIIRSLEDAKKVKAIATTTGWFSEQLLKDAGFTNLVSSPLPTTNVQQLMKGEVQLSLFTDLTIPEIVKQAGYRLEDLEPVFMIQSTYFHITLSLGTPLEVVDEWRRTIGAIKADGTFSAIYWKYVPGADLSDLLKP
ncbi:MAG: transporter substrate-binding domain-containing protein, partial [Syntrophales bacterium LBB04]|nr:transporter substrate-binding domain-containing protein [Syntrophales bacterium LBB04]